VLGFLRETVFAATVGASAELDAFLVAQGPQNIVITLVSTAVVTSAIPVLASRRSAQSCGGEYKRRR
jgi:putative peptidoglycan lipid II flippase